MLTRASASGHLPPKLPPAISHATPPPLLSVHRKHARSAPVQGVRRVLHEHPVQGRSSVAVPARHRGTTRPGRLGGSEIIPIAGPHPPPPPTCHGIAHP